MFNALGAVLFFSIFIFSSFVRASECAGYVLSDATQSSLIFNTTSLILPEPQFLTPESIAHHVSEFIKTDSQSVLYKDIDVVEVKYDEANDQIYFIVKYKVDIPLDSIEIIFTKKGHFEFDHFGQIIGFSLDPVFQLQQPGFLSKEDGINYNLWLIEFIQKSNFWNTRNRYLFAESREIFASHEALAALPVLLVKRSALAFIKSLEASVWQTLPLDLRKQIALIEVNNFDSGEFGQGSFDVVITLDDELVEKTGYKLISRANINKNSFKLSILKDNMDEIDITSLDPEVRQRLLDYRYLFLPTNPYSKFKFEIQ